MTETRNISLPGILLAALLAAVSVWGYFVCIRDPVFRSFDQADIALVARNLIRGNGYTTDAIWLWVSDWGAPHHPADIWPLLQPTLTALIFLQMGVGVFAQKLVCVLQLLALLGVVYFIGKRIFGAWEGVIAAALVLVNDRVPLLLAMGLNDIGAAFLYLGAVYALYRSMEEDSGRRRTIFAALWTGFAILQKFQGVVFVFAYAAGQAARVYRDPRRVLRQSALFISILFIVGLPMIIRNMKAFGRPTYPTSAIVNALGSSWDPSYMRWRALMVHYKLYWKHEKPSYSYLIKHRGPLYFFVKRPIRELQRLFDLLLKGIIINRIIIVFAILGAIASWEKRRAWVKWNGLVVLCSFSMVLFRNVEARYYLFLVPMGALFAACFLAWSVRKLRERAPILPVVFVIICAAILIQPEMEAYRSTVELSKSRQDDDVRFLKMCAWLRDRLKPGEGVISYDAATVSFYTEHPAACVPNVDLAEWIELADRYKLRYFIIGNTSFYLGLFSQAGTQHWVLRQMAPLLVGKNAYGFNLEYSDGKELYLYRIPRPGEVDLAALPKLPPEPPDFTRLLLQPERGGYSEKPPPLASQ